MEKNQSTENISDLETLITEKIESSLNIPDKKVLTIAEIPEIGTLKLKKIKEKFLPFIAPAKDFLDSLR